jgi:hypothetical protein
MRSKALCVLLSVLFTGSLFLGWGPDAFAAKKSGGGSSRSSSPSPRTPSQGPKPQGPPSKTGYGNTATKPDTAKTPASGGYGSSSAKPPGAASAPPSGYGNTATSAQGKSAPAGAQPAKTTPLQQQMNRSFSKQESAKAYEEYKGQQGKFQKTSTGAYNPSAHETSTIHSIQSRVTYTAGTDYYARRTVFYSSYGWSPPVYVYHSYNTFGIWDAMMLWFMLDHIYEAQYAAMYYNHRDDPGMQQFRNEVQRLSAENADLKAKLAKMDESSKALEQQGVKKDPSYIPDDAASIALAADIATKGAPKSGGFPWMWVIVIGVLALVVFYFMRRR